MKGTPTSKGYTVEVITGFGEVDHKMTALLHGFTQPLEERITRLEAENAKYTAALERIARHVYPDSFILADHIGVIQQIARDALAG